MIELTEAHTGPSSSPFASYKRACARVLASHDISPHPESEKHRISAADVITIGLTDGRTEKQRFEIWTAESYLYSLRCIERGDYVQAFKSYVQAREYVGRLGSWDPLGSSDVRFPIARAIENALRKSM